MGRIGTTRAELARRVLALIDLTDLSESSNVDAVRALCRRADGPHGAVAAVCIWPEFVRAAADELRGSGVRVATVVNFPGGDDDVDAVVAQTRVAIGAGADEIDLVLPYREFLAGRVEPAATMVEGVRAAAAHPVRLKVILETGAYPDQDSVAEATALAIDAGSDFVKTSTGKIPVSATVDAVETILRVIAVSERTVGVKPSGGIRTLDDATTYLALADRIMGPQWAAPDTLRFGASALLDAVQAELA